VFVQISANRKARSLKVGQASKTTARTAKGYGTVSHDDLLETMEPGTPNVFGERFPQSELWSLRHQKIKRLNGSTASPTTKWQNAPKRPS
jgi:hypothetical protein